MERKIIITSDGSHSVYVPELNEHYHSRHGAIRESMHVFINAGFKKMAESKSQISIFEAGFGTGLNTFLTYLEAAHLHLEVQYTTVEAFPLENEIIKTLNYPEELKSTSGEKLIFEKLHACSWEKTVQISKFFALKKLKITLQELDLKKESFDLIYYDAFGPPTQPEMWTAAIFSKLITYLTPGGILVTYCAKGEVKRTLKKVGFSIESLAGPPGKREMVRAIKTA
jgi:tRNA U34 5-methylaminomethyl-2-thiouridine-forming methyltransferase MnmC